MSITVIGAFRCQVISNFKLSKLCLVLIISLFYNLNLKNINASFFAVLINKKFGINVPLGFYMRLIRKDLKIIKIKYNNRIKGVFKDCMKRLYSKNESYDNAYRNRYNFEIVCCATWNSFYTAWTQCVKNNKNNYLIKKISYLRIF